MHEHLLKIEDCISRAAALGYLLATHVGDDSICRSGLMIKCDMDEAQDALGAHMAASRAEKGQADEAPHPEKENGFDADRYRRGVSLLTVLLEKTEWNASTAIEADTLEVAIAELKAAGGL